MDFRKFLVKAKQTEGDFLMVDPPLGNMCKKVGAKTFSEQDMKDLLAFLEAYKQKWMLLVKTADVTEDIDCISRGKHVRYAGFHKEVAVITNYL